MYLRQNSHTICTIIIGQIPSRRSLVHPCKYKQAPYPWNVRSCGSGSAQNDVSICEHEVFHISPIYPPSNQDGIPRSFTLDTSKVCHGWSQCCYSSPWGITTVWMLFPNKYYSPIWFQTCYQYVHIWYAYFEDIKDFFIHLTASQIAVDN